MRQREHLYNWGDVERGLADVARRLGIPASECTHVFKHLRYVATNSRHPRDATQAGCVGLLKALPRYDPAKGVRLVSFAKKYLKGEIAKMESKLSRPPSIFGEDGDVIHEQISAEPSVECVVEAADQRKSVCTFVRGLPKRWQHLVRRVYSDGVSQAEVARELRISRAMVSKMMARIYARGRRALGQYDPARQAN